jgi:two-component system response regulator FixJ
MKQEPTVYIVDDDPAMRRSTSLLLESASFPYKAFDSGMAFLEEVKPAHPGCVILDLHMPGMSGMDLVAKMRADQFKQPILIVSGTGTIPVAVEAMKFGVVDFLVKPVDPDVLLSKVKSAIEADLQERADNEQLGQIRLRLASLTPRERELLDHIVAGMPNKNIATTLGISIKTVENHRASLMAKTNALNAAHLVRMTMMAAK